MGARGCGDRDSPSHPSQLCPAPALTLAWPKSKSSGEGAGGHPPPPKCSVSHQAAQGSGCFQWVPAALGASQPPPFLPASCDFERDMCGWSSPSDPHLHSVAWGWKSGVPLAKYPGPEQDHTLGTRNGRRHPSLQGTLA